jgi:hypothetical protein
MNKHINRLLRWHEPDAARIARHYCEECGGVAPQRDRDVILDKHFRRFYDAGLFRPF